MQKKLLIAFTSVAFALTITFVVLLSIFFVNQDKIVTERITLKYFEKSFNTYSRDNLKEFVAKSEEDVLYKRAVNKYEEYRYEGASDYKFTIKNYELFGTGKYQCYFNLAKTPECDTNYTGRYMNYLVDATIDYKNISGDKVSINLKGLVVFVKDGSNGNLFEWKLVRFNTYEV